MVYNTQNHWVSGLYSSSRILNTAFWKMDLLPKNAVFWDVRPCGSCKNRRYSETSVLTRAIRRNIPEDGILHSHLRENLKSYMELLPSPGHGKEIPTLLGPLESANLSHWTRHGRCLHSPHLRTETDPVSKTQCFRVI
jgi:hypothetical protein